MSDGQLFDVCPGVLLSRISNPGLPVGLTTLPACSLLPTPISCCLALCFASAVDPVPVCSPRRAPIWTPSRGEPHPRSMRHAATIPPPHRRQHRVHLVRPCRLAHLVLPRRPGGRRRRPHAPARDHALAHQEAKVSSLSSAPSRSSSNSRDCACPDRATPSSSHFVSHGGWHRSHRF